MKYLLLIVSFLWTTGVWASPELKVGDILLQPLDCWSCDLIEDEEQSIYSHMGIVVSINPVMVADSRRKVEIQTLEEFNSITEENQDLKVLRFHNEEIVAEFEKKSQNFLNLFKSDFEGLAYDHDFRWNNFSEDGQQKLYCSEMIAKLLQAFLGIDPIVKRMHFSRNPELWERYFKGNVPRGQWGNSPADFERSDLFMVVGEI
ncbi:MAG: YiiX/YebB-like N1pC/P60 family cysteine hydrolase [Bdellovibrionota bacterium]